MMRKEMQEKASRKPKMQIKKESAKRLTTFMHLSFYWQPGITRILPNIGVPKGIRTPVLTVKG
jgi:hypothetical protein